MDFEPLNADENARGAYSCQAEYPGLSGRVSLTVGRDGLTADGLFASAAIAYADIWDISLRDYTVYITTLSGVFAASSMGNECQWFYNELLEAFCSKVETALLAEGTPLFETKGRYSFDGLSGECTLRVHKNGLFLLPAGSRGRMIPFLFVNGMETRDFTLNITASPGEKYSLSMLGYDLQPLEKAIKKQIQEQNRSGAEFIGHLDEKLGFGEIPAAARALPQGVIVPLSTLSASFPSLAAILERKAENSKMRDTYPILKEICSCDGLCLGIKELPPEEVELLKAALLESLAENQGDGDAPAELTEQQEDSLRWIVIAAVPSKDGKTAVVEFAFPGEESATYLFKISGHFEDFLPLLNRGLTASDMHREPISLSAEKLESRQYDNLRIMTERTPSLMELRKRFAGRVIHRSPSGWKKSLTEALERLAGENAATPEEPAARFCTSCGGKIMEGNVFCPSCGKKIR